MNRYCVVLRNGEKYIVKARGFYVDGDGRLYLIMTAQPRDVRDRRQGSPDHDWPVAVFEAGAWATCQFVEDAENR